MSYHINCIWDDDACVWIATSNDVPGLVLESGSLDVLMERVKNAVPELLELNNISTKAVTLVVKSEREEPIAVYG